VPPGVSVGAGGAEGGGGAVGSARALDPVSQIAAIRNAPGHDRNVALAALDRRFLAISAV